MGNASSVDNCPSNLPTTLQGNRIDFQDIDKVDPSVLQYLLNQEIEANQKIEESINSEREIPQIKLLLLGAQWGRNVFINCCKFMFGGPLPVEVRVECLPKIRWRIVSQINRLLTSIPREKLSELEGHVISLSEFPSPDTELTPSFLNQTKSSITTLWLNSTIQAEYRAQRWSIDPLFPHVIENAEKIFGTELYIPVDTEIFFAKSEDSTEGVVETEFQILLPQKFKFHLTDISQVDARRKKVLDQFGSVDAVIFLVDMLDNYSQNGNLPDIFSEFVNSRVLKKKTCYGSWVQ